MVEARMNATVLRALEAFLFVFISAFLSQLAVTGTPIDITNADSQSRILTAFLAAAGIAFRQFTVTRSST
jgi:hypothetical protein